MIEGGGYFNGVFTQDHLFTDHIYSVLLMTDFPGGCSHEPASPVIRTKENVYIDRDLSRAWLQLSSDTFS